MRFGITKHIIGVSNMVGIVPVIFPTSGKWLPRIIFMFIKKMFNKIPAYAIIKPIHKHKTQMTEP